MKGVMGRYVRGLGADDVRGTDDGDDPMAADVTAEGDVITHAPAPAAFVSSAGVLGFSWPTVLLVAAGAWFLTRGR